MIKKLVVSICLLFAVVSFAQEGTSSPYSFYGIGDVKFKGTVDNRSMGGLSIFRDSIHINLQNPASLSGLKLTSFSVGGNTDITKLSTYNSEDKTKRTTLDYVAVAIPLGKKFASSFGIIPFSSVGYKIQNYDTPSATTMRYYGSGGINKVYFSLAYNITQNLSIGVTGDYNFGTINTTSQSFIDNVQYGSQEINSSDLRGASFTGGLMYATKLKGKIQYFSGLTFSPQGQLNLNNLRNISVVQYNSTGSTTLIDNTVINVPNSTIKLPSKISFGFGLGQPKKWQVGTEVVWQQTSSFGNRYNDINQINFENSTKYIVGGFYIPKYNSFTSYLDRITYRAGVNYQNTGMIINNKSIKEQAINLGLGLPLSGTFSNLNFGLEIGKRGTLLSGLIMENYTNISIGLSFNDKWFVKRKYD